MSETTKDSRQVRAISQDRIILARSAHNTWNVRVPVGTLPEDLLNPEYWKHVAQASRFKPGDDIVARCEDRTWRAHYEIRDVGTLHASLALLKPDSDGVCWFDNLIDLPMENETHYVEWVNVGVGAVVKRKSDKETIEKGFSTKERAAEWMHRHVKAIAA